MAIKYADTIINEIQERGPIITSETSVNGEEFEKWIYGEEMANVAPVLLPAMNNNEYFRKKYETNIDVNNAIEYFQLGNTDVHSKRTK